MRNNSVKLFLIRLWFRRCRLKDFLSGALAPSWSLQQCNFWMRASWGTFMRSNIKFGPVVQEISFKDISHLQLWQPLCSLNWIYLCNFGRRHHEEQFCVIILNLDQWFRRKWGLKGISYLELWQPFGSVERNHLCNFRRWYSEEQFCIILLHLGQKMTFKLFLIWSSGGPPARTYYAILKEGIMGNIHVKIYEIPTSGSEGDSV